MPSSPLATILYCSVLSPTAGPTCVGDIVRTARRTNAAQQVTGVLVFDGQRFCQYLEGPHAAVAALVDRIRHDPRHTDFTLLDDSALHGPRRFHGRPFAYALADDAEPLAQLQRLRGPQALAGLGALMPQLDLGPALTA